MIWGRSRKDREVAGRFVAAVNAHDLAALGDLMTDDFAYIDSWREGIVGRDKVLAAVGVLFATDPDFGIEVERTSFRAPHVMMSGTVSSMQFGEARRAVWRARCEGGRLAEWQSWAEGGPPPMSRTLAPGAVRDLSDRAEDKPDEI
jgi:hypothetical protein